MSILYHIASISQYINMNIAMAIQYFSTQMFQKCIFMHTIPLKQANTDVAFFKGWVAGIIMMKQKENKCSSTPFPGGVYVLASE